jgi:hypothetical protein
MKLLSPRLFAVILPMLIGLVLIAIIPDVSAQEAATVIYEWNKPTERENGEPLAAEEIGGYEIRVTPATGEPIHILVQDPSALSFELSDHPGGDYTASIAVYDINGLYSNFVEITGRVNAIPPLPPTEFRARQIPFASALEKCLVERLCQVYTPTPGG